MILKSIRRVVASATLAALVAACAASSGGDPAGRPANSGLHGVDRSVGCSRPSGVGAPFTFRGEAIEVIVDRPGGQVSGRPLPLILAFHGRTGSAEEVRGYFDLDEVSANPAILVYPQSRRPGWGARPDGQDGDLALVDTLVGELGRRYCIDRSRIFAVGHSMGGSFVNDIACARASIFRATATVAGGRASVKDCRGKAAAAILHNPDDSIVSEENGRVELERRLAQLGLASVAPTAVAGTPPCRLWGSSTIVDPVMYCTLASTRDRRGRIYSHGWPPGTAERIRRFFDALPPARLLSTSLDDANRRRALRQLG